MHRDAALEIVVTRQDGFGLRCASRMRRAVRTTLERHRVPAAKINITLVDDAFIAVLNERYRGRRGPTDVLAFDLGEDLSVALRPAAGRGKSLPRPVDTGVQAEIVVSVDAARREAAARGHGIAAELTLYAVHGVLHLLGYDDRRKSGAARMHRVEDEILSSVGLGSVFRTAPL